MKRDMIEEGLNLRNDLLVPTITSAQAKQMRKDNPPVPTIQRCSGASSAALALDRSLKAGGTVGDVVTADMIRTYCAADTLQSGRKEVT